MVNSNAFGHTEPPCIPVYFVPLSLVFGVELVFPIESNIPSLKLVIELVPNTFSKEEQVLYLQHLDKTG